MGRLEGHEISQSEGPAARSYCPPAIIFSINSLLAGQWSSRGSRRGAWAASVGSTETKGCLPTLTAIVQYFNNGNGRISAPRMVASTGWCLGARRGRDRFQRDCSDTADRRVQGLLCFPHRCNETALFRALRSRQKAWYQPRGHIGSSLLPLHIHISFFRYKPLLDLWGNILLPPFIHLVPVHTCY